MLKEKKEVNANINQVTYPHQLLQFQRSFTNSADIIGIHDIDDSVIALIVVSPERADLVLATNVPHRKVDVLVFHSFHIESNRRNSGHNFTELQLV
jgi:hypothetical protein